MGHLVGRIQAATDRFVLVGEGIFAFAAIILITMLASNLAHARTVYVFDVKRNIPLSDYEPIYKDYYINAGIKEGLKKDLVINIIRNVSMKNLSGRGGEELVVPVGQLRIIHAQAGLSVARLATLHSRSELPTLEQVGILVGDRIDMKGAFVEKSEMRKPAGVETDLTQDSMQKVLSLADLVDHVEQVGTEEAAATPPQSLEAAPTPAEAPTSAQDPNLAMEPSIELPKDIIEVPVQVLNPAGQPGPTQTSELDAQQPTATQ